MRLPARSAAWLLPLLLTGCIHKQAQVALSPPLAPSIEDTPPAKPEPAPVNLPPPEVTLPVQQPVADATPPPAEPPKKVVKKKKPQNTNPQQALNEVSAIGQLSGADTPNMRQQTDSLIESTEKTLNGINRSLSDQEKEAAAQIREFIKEARAALSSGDVDGAHTLAIKAKVLLDELHS